MTDILVHTGGFTQVGTVNSGHGEGPRSRSDAGKITGRHVQFIHKVEL
jgi:hypothetical protein